MPPHPVLFVRFFSASGAKERAVILEPGQTLAQAVYLSGLFTPPALCAGLGRCGRCRMRLSASGTNGADSLPAPLPEERRCLSEEERGLGWRLGCQHAAGPGMTVELPPDAVLVPEVRETEESGPRCAGDAPWFLAVDLGTTTLEWALCTAGLSDGNGREAGPVPEATATGREINPQMGAGSDVVSRLAMARLPGGSALLGNLTLAALRRIAGRAEDRIAAVCLAANPAMTCIALGKETRTLSVAPYRLPYAGGVWETLPGLPPVWIPPQISPFVGGDLTAGYAAVAMNPSGAYRSLGEDAPGPHRDENPVPFPFLLADLGTNGEFLLALDSHTAMAASVALGPALEGIGLACGVEARPLAVTGFTLSPQGLVPLLFNTQSPSTPSTVFSGITGTGYLSLLHNLRKAGAMDEGGRFTLDGSPLLRRTLGPLPGPRAGGEPCLPLPGKLFLTASDVEEILKVKAAFSLGLRLLLEEAGTASRRIARVYLAGAFGRHVDTEALENLGFFPSGMGGRMMVLGNAALAGAGLLLCREEVRDALCAWAAGVRSLDLAQHPVFVREFADHMRFAW